MAADEISIAGTSHAKFEALLAALSREHEQVWRCTQVLQNRCTRYASLSASFPVGPLDKKNAYSSDAHLQIPKEVPPPKMYTAADHTPRSAGPWSPRMLNHSSGCPPSLAQNVRDLRSPNRSFEEERISRQISPGSCIRDHHLADIPEEGRTGGWIPLTPRSPRDLAPLPIPPKRAPAPMIEAIDELTPSSTSYISSPTSRNNTGKSFTQTASSASSLNWSGLGSNMSHIRVSPSAQLSASKHHSHSAQQNFGRVSFKLDYLSPDAVDASLPLNDMIAMRSGSMPMQETSFLSGNSKYSADRRGWEEVGSLLETLSGETSSHLRKVDPNVMNRLRNRLGVLNWNGSVSAQDLFRAVSIYGLERFSFEEIQDLITHMGQISGTLDFDEDEEMGCKSHHHFPFPGAERLSRLSVTLMNMTRTSSGLTGGKVRRRYIPFPTLAAFLLTDERLTLGQEKAEKVRVLKEILLSGDANRLVAELTCVRIDDLAAPPPNMDWEMLLEPLVCFMIIFNGVIIGMQTDPSYETWPGWTWIESCFTLFFTAEIFFRMSMVGVHEYFQGRDKYWNWFDFSIVMAGIVNTIVDIINYNLNMTSFTIMRTLRLTRLPRLVRIFRLGFLKELTLMIKGLFAGARTLFWALLLLFSTIYVLSVVATYNLSDSDETVPHLQELPMKEELFTSVPRSMLTCFRCFVGDCNTSTGRPIVKLMSDAYGVWFVIPYLASFTFVTLGLFNLIMALYVEITMAAAKRTEEGDKKRRERESLRVAHTTKKLLKKFCVALNEVTKRNPCIAGFATGNAQNIKDVSRMMWDSENHDVDSEMTINKELFLLVVQDQEVQKLMNDLDIPPDRANLFDVLDADGTGDLHVTELVHGLLKVRGEARKSDIIASLLAVRAVQDMLRLMEKRVLGNQTRLMEHLGISSSSTRLKHRSIWDRQVSEGSMNDT